MQFATSIVGWIKRRKSGLFITVLLLSGSSLFAQNSPYSRYGLGDAAPNTHITNRGMGGISAGYADVLSVNFNNPASYAAFKTFVEERSKQPISGRVLLDVGISVDNRTLRNPNQPEKFSSTGASFSYVQLGIPLRRNWGMSFGLRPLTRIGYKISKLGLLNDGHTGNVIDSAYTEYTGEGGAFLPNIGTGFSIGNFSLGASMGYLFGKKEYGTRLVPLNDSINYQPGNFTTRTSFGGLFFSAGAQYRINFSKQTYIRLGASGNWEQNINASQDIVRETFIRNITSGDIRLDSVYTENERSGEIIYPASYTVGFLLEHLKEKGNGWQLGADLVQSKWNNYRFFGITDSVQNNWQVRVGGQFRPEPARNYFSNVAYRGGFFVGPDYIKVGNELPQFGISFGLGLPIANYNRLSPGQFSVLNLGIEYSRRGNNSNTLKENIFRVSAGFTLSDLWFSKRRYD